MEISLGFALWNFTHFQCNTSGIYPNFTATHAITSTNTCNKLITQTISQCSIWWVINYVRKCGFIKCKYFRFLTALVSQHKCGRINLSISLKLIIYMSSANILPNNRLEAFFKVTNINKSNINVRYTIINTYVPQQHQKNLLVQRSWSSEWPHISQED